MRAKQKFGFLVDGKRIIPTAQKFQTHKDYSVDLYQREFIIALRMNKGSFHQIWNGKKSWFIYTW